MLFVAKNQSYFAHIIWKLKTHRFIPRSAARGDAGWRALTIMVLSVEVRTKRLWRVQTLFAAYKPGLWTQMQSEVIALALERGVLTPGQADALRRLSDEIAREPENTRDIIIAPRTGEPAPFHDDEDLKFVGGFGDIFVTIGLVLFLGALAYFSGKVGESLGTFRIGGEAASSATACATWFLAEYFTRERRMALPSIVMLLAFIACCLTFFMFLFIGSGGGEISAISDRNLTHTGVDITQRLIFFGRVFAAFTATAVLAAIYYWRFRVPVAVAGAIAVLGGVVVSLTYTISPEFTKQYAIYVILLYGLGVFALAMHFDMSDTLRCTRRTDIAFWLHLLAAPLIVHPMLNPVVREQALTGERAASIISVFLLLGAVAIVIDRRAILVSSLTYAGISFATLIEGTGMKGFVSESVPLTMLTLGAFILLISVGWHPIRRLVLKKLPAGIARRLYNPYTIDTGLSSNPS
jgi:hypothetical protein